jgi:hypothetical protein
MNYNIFVEIRTSEGKLIQDGALKLTGFSISVPPREAENFATEVLNDYLKSFELACNGGRSDKRKIELSLRYLDEITKTWATLKSVRNYA